MKNKTQDKKEILKGIIRDIHKGVEISILQQRFADLIKEISPTELSKLEQSLIDEGLPESEITRLCDLHVAVFKQSLDTQKKPQAPPGHPVHTFMLENRETERILKKLHTLISTIGTPSKEQDFKHVKKEIENTIIRLSEIDKHYLRKENQLFPLLEAQDVTGPPQVMWGIHDDIRATIKEIKKQLSHNNISNVISEVHNLQRMIKDMIYKEEQILYPMSLDTLSDDDWEKVRSGEEEIGYAWVQPEGGFPISKAKKERSDKPSEEQTRGTLPLDTGHLSLEHINLILTHLPVDISFVNENDEVMYYSDTAERLFPRSPGVIGRKVQKCHPPKSIHVVEKILNEFKAGKKNVAEFWIQLSGKFIHIRYFAVRDATGTYKGTLEVSQDITPIKKLEGERRLLDWK